MGYLKEIENYKIQLIEHVIVHLNTFNIIYTKLTYIYYIIYNHINN